MIRVLARRNPEPETTMNEFNPIVIVNGYMTAIVSRLKDGAYLVAGRNGGTRKTYRTLEGAINAANKYVGK